jgi:hypothetical protein
MYFTEESSNIRKAEQATGIGHNGILFHRRAHRAAAEPHEARSQQQVNL